MNISESSIFISKYEFILEIKILGSNFYSTIQIITTNHDSHYKPYQNVQFSNRCIRLVGSSILKLTLLF